MTRGLYKGFSSIEYQSHKTFALRDIELVKQDLLNHIYTRVGERVMMPTFGTRIPDLAFEPLDETTLMIVEDDLHKVIRFDPRVELVNLSVIPDYTNNAILASVTLLYKEFAITDTINLDIVTEGGF